MGSFVDYFLLPPGRGGGGGLAFVVGSNLPPFFGSNVPAMVIPLVRFDSSTTSHRNHNTPYSVATRSRDGTFRCISGHIGNIDH